MAHYKPRFPRAVNGENYRAPYDADPTVEAISSQMDVVYSGFELTPDDRARLLMLHRRLAGEACSRYLARKNSCVVGNGGALDAVRVDFIEFARRVGAVIPGSIEADDDDI